MNPEDLGYTKKWIEYGLINRTILEVQFAEFLKGEDTNTEHYRYASFLNWLHSKEKLTDQELNHFIELAGEDENALMAGSAIKELFCSPIITDDQFELIKMRMPEFGSWTQKLIERETLKRAIQKTGITMRLFELSIQYKKNFNDNSLIHYIIEETEDTTILNLIIKSDSGKHIKNTAMEKMSRLTKRNSLKP